MLEYNIRNKWIGVKDVRYNDEYNLLNDYLNGDNTVRYLNPDAILIERGYRIDVFAEGLNIPTSILFTEEGELLVTALGKGDDPGVYRFINSTFELIGDQFQGPITGINYRNGDIYVSHKGVITLLKEDGSKQNLLWGLPSQGDHGNSRVAFGMDNKMYFGLGTATNSGVVGNDNRWVCRFPLCRDNPGYHIILNGENYKTRNMLLMAEEEILTGAFSAYGEPNQPFEQRKAIIKASGSILRSNPDGTELEQVVWGLRCPSYLEFDRSNRLYVSNHGYDVRGSRPIANAPDEFWLITEGQWYGWPDYAGGEPVTMERFRPEGGVQPQFLLACHPNIPPKPFALFPPESTITGFAFNYNRNFGNIGDVYIAEFGSISMDGDTYFPLQYPSVGHKISRIDIHSRSINTFAMNKSGFSASVTGDGGLSRPCGVAFGKDGAMYILDSGINHPDMPNRFIPNTGVIWRVVRDA
ncbi:glucose/arabinose dehydrogenase [Anaerotaenia torta]|uniref:PQQ-dependent sugar dehydrogenase n=1 Tax=Anaerotaenia torta TaxID=433293 RepID=UPI003D25B75C